MVEKSNFMPHETADERFAFVLSVNGNIICRRNFWIGGFRERSLGSVQLVEAMEKCVDLIKDDMKEKSSIYLWYTAPQVFSSKEEMNKWVENPTFTLEVPSFVVIDNSEETFIWNGTEMVAYNRPFPRNEYAKPLENEDYERFILKFSFLDSDREVHSISWDAGANPKFVRSNIDLMNKKNKFDVDGLYAPIESFVTNVYVSELDNLLPEISGIISSACRMSDYTSTLNYGDKKYPVDINRQNEIYYKKIEMECRNKTTKYFKSLRDEL